MTPADIRVAAYREAIALATSVVNTTGPLTATGARLVIAHLQDRIEELTDREHHRMVVEAL